MNILAFDTATDIMYITLGKDNEVLDSRKVESTAQNYNSAFLISTIANVLADNKLIMQDIKAVGVNIGPGSFTGLRASITAARIIAQQMDIPAIGIPSTQIYSRLNITDKNSFCLIDARRGKAYTAIYDKNTSIIMSPCALEYNKALEMLKKGDYFLISDTRMVKTLEENGFEFVNFEETGSDYGEFLLQETFKTIQEKRSEELKWYNLKPLYIQPPPVTISGKNNR